MIISIGASTARTQAVRYQGVDTVKLWLISLLLCAGALTVSIPVSADALGFDEEIHDLPSLGSQQETPAFDEEELGQGLYKALERPHRLAEAVGGYGLRALLEESGITYEEYRKFVKKITRFRLTPDSEFYAEPNSLNVESRYLDGEVVTRFSTKTNGDVRLSVEVPF